MVWNKNFITIYSLFYQNLFIHLFIYIWNHQILDEALGLKTESLSHFKSQPGLFMKTQVNWDKILSPTFFSKLNCSLP